MKKITRGKINAFLHKYATENKVLDIGSGNAAQDERFPNRTTFDIDPARKPQIVGDIHQMPFKDAEFQTILCSEVLEHLTDPTLAISEMSRVLAPGGLLILTTRFIFPVHDAPGDYWRFTPYGLRYLFTEWDILEEESETNTFATVAVLLQRIIFQTNVKGGRITKGFLLLFVLFFERLNFLVKKEYGDIQRSHTVPGIMTSGVYIAVRKRK